MSYRTGARYVHPAVSVLVVAQPSSKVPEGLTNYPIYKTVCKNGYKGCMPQKKMLLVDQPSEQIISTNKYFVCDNKLCYSAGAYECPVLVITMATIKKKI